MGAMTCLACATESLLTAAAKHTVVNQQASNAMLASLDTSGA
jgi:hypothetical protein